MRRIGASSVLTKRAPAVLAALLASSVLLGSVSPSHAQDATWLSNPGSSDFNTPGNWSPASVPTGTAFFGTSTVTNVTISATTTLDGWTFNSDASAYTITNNGNVTVVGAGLTMNNGGSLHIVNNSGLWFGASSGVGSAIITTTSGANTTMNNPSGSGAARFILNAGGLLLFWSASFPTFTVGSLEGAGDVLFLSAELAVGGNNRSTEFSGLIEDDFLGGALTKIGTGTLVLSGMNGYLGATNVNGGTLLVNSSIELSSAVFVNSGATLGGTGVVPFTLLNDGATLAPGTPNAIGTLTINDRVMFCACSTFAVKVSSTGSDRVSVLAPAAAGDAFLGGTVRVSSLDRSYRFNSPYTILTAVGGLNGTQFDTLVLPTGMTGTLGYTANDVTLTLSTALGGVANLGGNQRRIADILDTFFNANGSTSAFGGVFGGDVNAKLAQLSGQPATGLTPAGMQMTGAFLNTMLHPAGRSAGDPASGGTLGFSAEAHVSSEAAAAYAAVTPNDRKSAPALADPRWNVWGQFYGGHRTVDGDSATGAADTTARTYGVATGFDYRAASDIVVGMALAGGEMNYGVADGLGGGKSDVFQIGLYGTKKFGAAYVSAALSYAWHDASTDRTVTVSGTDRLVADFSAHSFGARLEGGYRFDTAVLGVTPYAAVQVQAFRTSAYGETATMGSNAFALSYEARTAHAKRTELGAWFDKTMALDLGATVTWRAKLAWAHDFTSDQSINATFQSLPGSSFTVDGARAAPNAALLSAGAELRLINNWSVAAKFDGEFASGARTYAGTGTLRYVW